jgi:hypothetical protein
MSIWNTRWSIPETITIGTDGGELNNPSFTVGHIEISQNGFACCIGLLCQEANSSQKHGRILYFEDETQTTTWDLQSVEAKINETFPTATTAQF